MHCHSCVVRTHDAMHVTISGAVRSPLSHRSELGGEFRNACSTFFNESPPDEGKFIEVL